MSFGCLLFGVEEASWSVGGSKLCEVLSALLEGGPLDHCVLIDVLLISCGLYWPHCLKGWWCELVVLCVVFESVIE